MACGCSDSSCSCVVQGANGVTVSGSGNAGNPYLISPPAETVFSGIPGDGIAITPGGSSGHSPTIAIEIDPDSEAPISVSEAGLRVDCCTEPPIPYNLTVVVGDQVDDGRLFTIQIKDQYNNDLLSSIMMTVWFITSLDPTVVSSAGSEWDIPEGEVTTGRRVQQYDKTAILSTDTTGKWEGIIHAIGARPYYLGGRVNVGNQIINLPDTLYDA